MNFLSKAPIYPFLLAAYPILNLYAQNSAEIPLVLTLPSFAVALAAISLLLVLAYAVLRDRTRAAVFASLCAVFFFGYTHVYGALLAAFVRLVGADSAYALVRHRYLVPVWVLLFCLGVALSMRKSARLSSLTPSLNIAAFALVAMPALTLIPSAPRFHVIGSPMPSLNFSRIDAPQERPRMLRDIYYIILDEYGSGPILKNHYGYDNRGFIDFLTRRGFYVASDSKANYRNTLFSLPSSLNADYLNAFQDRDFYKLVRSMEANRVEQFLKGLGYATVRFPTWWYPTRVSSLADIQFRVKDDRWDEFSLLVLRTTMIDRLVNVQMFSAREHTLNVLGKLPEVPFMKGPTFAFVHIICPHSPYVFQRNGEPTAVEPKLMSDYGPLTDEQRTMYIDQLVFLNKKVEQLIDQLISRSEVPPIIVIQGDHGPKREEGGRNYFGILNAYYLPDGGAAQLYPSISPVNTFRVILNHYFGTRLALLEDRSYFLPPGTGRRSFTEASNLE